jgi:hypothetical protein
MRRLRVDISFSTSVVLSSLVRSGRSINDLRPKDETLSHCAGRLLDRLAFKIREYETRFAALPVEPDCPDDFDEALRSARYVAELASELLPIVGSEFLRTAELIQHIGALEAFVNSRRIEVEVPVSVFEEDEAE